MVPAEGTLLEHENDGGSHTQLTTYNWVSLVSRPAQGPCSWFPFTQHRQRAAKVKVPQNNSPWFLDWHGFLRTPLPQAIATPIKLMTNAIMNNLMQSLILPIIATSRQLKQNRSAILVIARRLISTNRSNNFKNSFCLASIFSGVNSASLVEACP